MPRHSAVMEAALTGATQEPIGDIAVDTGAKLARFKLYDFMLGSNGTPADAAVEWQVARISAHGTRGSAITPRSIDPADADADADAGQGTYTIDPTAGNVLYQVPVNLRATWRWIAAPGGELIAPATDNNGFAFLATRDAAGTENVQVTAYFEE